MTRVPMPAVTGPPVLRTNETVWESAQNILVPRPLLALFTSLSLSTYSDRFATNMKFTIFRRTATASTSTSANTTVTSPVEMELQDMGVVSCDSADHPCADPPCAGPCIPPEGMELSYVKPGQAKPSWWLCASATTQPGKGQCCSFTDSSRQRVRQASQSSSQSSSDPQCSHPQCFHSPAAPRRVNRQRVRWN